MVLVLDFESTAAAKALWPKIEDKPTPIKSDIAGVQPADQGGLLFDGGGTHTHADGGSHEHPIVERLAFNRGGGLFARLLHVHAEVAHEYAATGSGEGSTEVTAAAG
jgi:hypothetical protein